MDEIVNLSESEQQIMDIVWQSHDGIYLSDLLDRLERMHKGWKRTTVQTFISRLCDKGYLNTHKEGRRSYLAATVSRREHLNRQTRQLVDKLFDGSAKKLVASLLQNRAISKSDMEELEEFWREGEDT